MRIADNSVPAVQLAPRVRVSPRARRVSVRVHLDGAVELVIPRGVPEPRARAFFESRLDWVRTQVARRRVREVAEGPFPPAHMALPAIDEHWRLQPVPGTARARVVEAAPGELVLSGSGDARTWQRLLRTWLKGRAQQAFEPRLASLARLHGFAYTRLTVRAQRSRWGSCSTRGTISLNLALLFQTPEVLRYLMCHELAHTRHMNHSAAFWRCVAGCEPGWLALDRALGDGWSRVPRWLLSRSGEP